MAGRSYMPEKETMANGTNKKNDLLSQTLEQLEQGVQDFMSSEKIVEYLKCVSSFYRYSVNNTILIAAQDPEATMVGSFTFWKSKGRFVERGQKGIKIIAPAPVKQKVEVEKIDPNTGEIIMDANGKPEKVEVEKTIPRFKVVTVFDVRQTGGEPLPELDIHELDAKVDNFMDFMIAIQKVSPVPIRFAEIDGEAKGYYHLIDNEIVIQSGMSESQTIKTCIHEVAHAWLHNRELMKQQGIVKDAQTKETEAEGVAFCVSTAFKIDTSSYSFPYIGSWSSGKELKELKASMDTIRVTAGEMIDQIQEQLEILEQERVELKAKEIEQLARDIDQFAYDYDTYEYRDSVENPETGVEVVKAAIIAGEIHEIREWLQEAADNIDLPEDAEAAKELLSRLESSVENVTSGQVVQKQNEELPTELAIEASDKFLYVQETEEGYDYTVYDSNFHEIDGGVLADEGITIEAVRDNLMNEYGLTGQSHPVDIEYLQEVVEQTEQAAISSARNTVFTPDKISFYVAECAEFPVLGEYHENLSLDEALLYFEKIPADRMNGVKGIGFELKDNSDYEGRFDLLVGNHIQRDIIDTIPYYRDHPLIQSAMKKLEDYQREASGQIVQKSAEQIADAVDGKKSVLGRLSANKETIKAQQSANKTKTQQRSKGGQELG
ncbi:ImmA/IrrE family metallo-endopeptidase [Lactonifactor sp. BIOML-A3]|nr:ImmA/IrrE family metallo-endopeptidase [Lactonifactor sp. BIOML-A5]MSA08711.1 ImmA/IrrE family metallo-endopeptidase [Lactonifactor sp. BIOML-A4]MSA13893.1 ImmA/IrrE family metallo-endopeptidase [Lactonifactor sp. BIOML-A3]MSA17134.1 ImmA/IrrE family metallo-endopeptidase [Lactonifactor sp. BIOML-A2]MSA37813.1 ImmA/IrrE family metallo-endopeptidase [Lactonifactor sp. BIOML-A1]MSB13641.1 ImmA/IrrE family metallo-endopeptidase [Lactonifactor sp. BIOML-A6]MSB70477.1 ImmA/IrrE family metallo-e